MALVAVWQAAMLTVVAGTGPPAMALVAVWQAAMLTVVTLYPSGCPWQCTPQTSGVRVTWEGRGGEGRDGGVGPPYLLNHGASVANKWEGKGNGVTSGPRPPPAATVDVCPGVHMDIG